jgi:Protoporphyrinogen oxidase
MEILIIGGGFAGCASAEILSHMKKSHITLVEKSYTLGAGVRTFFYGGHPFTYGPRLLITQRVQTLNYLKKFLKFRHLNEHQFKSYIEQDNSFYNYPLNKKDIEIMPDKKKN